VRAAVAVVIAGGSGSISLAWTEYVILSGSKNR
jgi:hypothetical protein